MKRIESNDSYHANKEAIGSTLLKKIAKTSLHHAVTSEVSESDALNFGNAVHTLTFEPETFDSRFIVIPKIDKRNNEGKALAARYEELAQGKTILTEEQLKGAKECVANIMAHPIASMMIVGGEAEYSYYSECSETGLKQKCRPDYFLAGSLIDLKTTRDASAHAFKMQSLTLGYHIQAAYYLDVFNKANEEKATDFYFIAVENTAPYAVSVFKMGSVEIDLGRFEYKEAMKKYAAYLKDTSKVKEFGYEIVINSLEYPPYAFEKLA